jgi:8-oxo-dGTP pyrophosphatase MutT (NUDIX family)
MADRKPPITLKSRRRIAENQVFDVYFDHIVHEGGAEVPTYLVVAPKAVSPDLVTGVSVLPVMDDRVGLLRLHRHAIGAMTWEVPRGFVEVGEPAAVSAVRELDEEVGLRVSPANLASAGLMTPEAGIIAARVALFIARDCEPVRDFAADEMGHSAFVWFNLEEALAMAKSSEIQDPSTLLLLYRLAIDALR